ncbi:MAG: type II secretion system F family protein [Solirubrobacteraceae bacterium]
MLFLLLGVVALGVGVAALFNVLTARRMRTSERLASINEYGFARERARAAPLFHQEPKTNPLSTFVGGVGNFVAKRAGSAGEESIRQELMTAGMYDTSPRLLLGYRVFGALLLPVFGGLLLGTSDTLRILMIALMLPAGYVLPITVVRRRARLRLMEVDRRLPDLIDLLCVMVEAGLGFLAAMRLASDRFKPPLGDELRLMLQEQVMGLSIEDALANLAKRCPTPAMKSFVRSMANGERMGISTGVIMRNLSHEMRLRRRRTAEERAQKAPVKMLFPLAFMIFPAMLIVLLAPGALTLINAF